MNFDMIAARELDHYREEKNVFLIDLRTPEEYQMEHIKGAVNIPYQKLEQCLIFPKDLELILYCERGSVSMAAARKLAAKGYRVKTVIGGFSAYHSVWE